MNIIPLRKAATNRSATTVTDNVMDDISSPQENWEEKLQAVGDYQDKKAFSELFNHFAPKLKVFLVTGYDKQVSYAMADDLVQEVMVKVWRKAASYQPGKAKASTWIYTIARNARIDMLRKQNPLKNALDTDDIWYEPESEETPFLDLQQERNKDIVSQQLRALQEDQRQVLFKAYMEGKSHTEIADELEIPLGTVKSRIRLAMKKLAINLDR